MDCLMIDITRNPGLSLFPNVQKLGLKRRLAYTNYYPCAKSSFNCHFTSVIFPMHPVYRKNQNWRAFASSVNLEEQEEEEEEREPSSSPLEETIGEDDDDKDFVYTDEEGRVFSRRLTSDELKSLLADSERSKLTRKLSEANQYNRFLKRQLQMKDDAVADFKSELAVLELELQALVGLAEEVVNSGIPPSSRQINGVYIHSHLLSRLEAMHEKIKEQIEGVDSFKFQEISMSWVGMAESVQIMGSFDGWSQGEEMSPEYSGEYAKFSATLKLRPGRYEIKFLVDGEWQLSPEFPTIGEGLMKNNLLIVE